MDDLDSSSGGEYSGDEILALLRARVQRIKDDIKRLFKLRKSLCFMNNY